MILLSFIKALGQHFFIWSLPFFTILINILKGRELFELNVWIALGIGFLIHFMWETVYLIMQKKEYHKNLL